LTHFRQESVVFPTSASDSADVFISLVSSRQLKPICPQTTTYSICHTIVILHNAQCPLCKPLVGLLKWITFTLYALVIPHLNVACIPYVCFAFCLTFTRIFIYTHIDIYYTLLALRFVKVLLKLFWLVFIKKSKHVSKWNQNYFFLVSEKLLMYCCHYFDSVTDCISVQWHSAVLQAEKLSPSITKCATVVETFKPGL